MSRPPQIMTQNDTLQSRVRDAVLEIDKLKSEKDIAVVRAPAQHAHWRTLI